MMAAPIPAAAVDLREGERFLDLMAEGEAVTFQTFDDSERQRGALARIYHGTLEEHGAELARLNAAGAGIFWMVNYGDGKGRSADNVTGIRALFVDLDGAPVAPVESATPEPHAVIESSPGKWHAYWLAADCAREQFTPLQKALAARFGGDPVVCDLPRVMRVPGFLHRKGEPFASRIVALCPLQPYPVADLVKGLGLRLDAPRATAQPATPAAAGPVFVEGGRNAALAKMAGKMRRAGLSAAEIEAGLLRANADRCRPPLPDAEVRAVARSIARYAPPAEPADTWPEPRIPGTIAPPQIPAALLPGCAGEHAQSVAESTQTPPAMAVLTALCVTAAAVQRRAVVAPRADAYTEPLCLWTLAAMESGSRKTAVQGAITAPLYKWEKLRRDALRSEIARVAAARAVAEKRIERLTLEAARAGTADERERIRTEIADERENMPAELRAPRIVSGDSTPERLQMLLAEHCERMALISDEGGLLGVLAGLYNGGHANIDTFLQAHSGSSIRVERAGRTAYLDTPALTLSLALQPGVLQEAGGNRRFADSGLLARFLFALPQSNIGSRDVRAWSAVPPDLSRRWEGEVMALLDGADAPAAAPRVLPFDDAARERWLVFADACERALAVGGRLHGMAGWGPKIAGQAARMAALIQFMRDGRDAATVSFDSADRACKLAGLLIEHARAVFRLIGADDAEGDAEHLLRWVIAQRAPEFDRSVAHKALESRFRKVASLAAAAARLHEWGCLSPERQRPNAGARPTPYYAVNPRLFDES